MKNKTLHDKAIRLFSDPLKLSHVLGYERMKDIHSGWIKQMMRFPADDMTLQAHRGSYKTTCLCVAIAMMMIRYRDKNIIFLRKTDTDVTEVIKQVQKILLTPIFQHMFEAATNTELKIAHSTGTEITLNCYSAPRGSAQLLGIGIGGSLTGKHADIIITDDIVNLKDRLSQAERDRTKAVYMELQNIRNVGGRIINTGTPWHKDDCFSIMPSPTVYDCYSTGLLTDEKIEELKRLMSPSLFAANYELRHIASEDALFETFPRFTTDRTIIRDGICHIDAAYGGEDSTAVTYGIRIGSTFYLYGKLYHGHVDTVLDKVLDESREMMCGPVYCENNADKGYLSREIRNRGYESHPYSEKLNKHIKISTFLRKWWDNIVFVEGTDKGYINQIMDYTEMAQHDDAPDSAACVCRIFDRRGE